MILKGYLDVSLHRRQAFAQRFALPKGREFVAGAARADAKLKI